MKETFLVLRWTGALLLAILALWLIGINATIFLHYVATRKHVSWVPLCGGICGCVSLLLLPIAQIKPFWWVPLVVDYGCLLGLGYTALWHVWHWATHN
jgi:hypothetical protein